jgi:SAM-dependent methyltransferase
MAKPLITEQAEYDARWGDEDKYSAANTGYTPFFLKFMEKWVARSEKKPPAALEVGCGDGFFSENLVKLGCKVTGIDLSPVGVAKAAARAPAGTFQVHDLTQPLPFADDSFDVAWCSEVLEHLFSPLSTLTEVHRVLKPGGRLLATVPYHGFLKNLGIALFAFDRHYDPEYPHIRFFTKNTLTALARKAGLEVEEASTCGSGLGVRDWFVPTNLLLVARKPAAR